MKSSSYVVSGIVALAIILLSIMSLSSCKDSGGNTANQTGSSESGEGFSGTTLPIAYINVDTLLTHYNYAKDVNERITKKMEDIRLTINQKTKKLESDYTEFQRKINNNAFLSEERAQQEAIKLQKQEQEIQETAQRLQNEWAMDQHKENAQIADSVRTVVGVINASNKYEVIFNMKELDNIISINPKYDITQEVLALLNSRYSKSETKK